MKSFLLTMIFGTLLLVSSARLQAQAPPHPNNGGNAPNGSNTPVGAGATLTDGSFILLALALSYAGRKIYVARSKMIKE